jgi:hypothetical protein
VLPVRYELNLCMYAEESRPLCGVVIRIPGYRTEMYCTSCEVRTQFIYVMQKKVDRLCGLVVRVPGYRSRCLGFHSRHYQISDK